MAQEELRLLTEQLEVRRKVIQGLQFTVADKEELLNQVTQVSQLLQGALGLKGLAKQVKKDL